MSLSSSSIVASVAFCALACIAGCGGATSRTFRSLDDFTAYVDSMPKSGVIDMTDASFTALVRRAAALDDAAFQQCVVEPLERGLVNDEYLLLLLPDTSVQGTACEATLPYYWRLSEPQRLTWLATDVRIRERFVATVSTYRTYWRQDSTIRLRYSGLSGIVDDGYKNVNAARLSLGSSPVYSVNLMR